MRRNFVLFALVPVIILFVVLYFFLDGWVESGLEYAGERVVGAKVEIDDLSLTLSPLGIRFERLQVADPGEPWFNIFETGRVQFAMDVNQLLRAKFIVETMEVNGLILGTKRTTDGSIPKPPPPPPDPNAEPSPVAQAATAIADDAKKAPVFDLAKLRAELNIDSLTNPANLATYRHLDSLRRQIDAAATQWDTTLAALDRVKAQADEVEARVRAINVNEIKTLPQATEAFNNAKAAYAIVEDVTKTINERKRSIADGINDLVVGIRQIDDIANQDYRNAVALAKLPDVSMSGLAQLALGKELMTKAQTYLGYADMVRSRIPEYTPKPDPAQEKRSQGINVHFPVERAYPKVWVKHVSITGGTDARQDPDYFAASGKVTDISNDQRITGRPLVVALGARKGNGTAMSFDAFFDRRGQTPHDNYKISMSGIPVGTMELGRSGFLPSKITDAIAKARIEVDIPGNKLNATTRVDFERLKVGFDREAHNLVERIVRDVLSSIDAFFVNLRVWRNDRGAIDVAFTTDLDDQISARARKAVGDEVARIQADIRAKVNAQIAAKRKEVEALYEQKRAEAMRRVNDVETQVKQKLTVVEQKKNELEQRVEQEKKKAEDSLKKKAGDALKGILKRN
jgi:uncharacterized protein (TIGR03545 family)